MKLSDMVVNQKIKMLLVGPSGSGKTVFSCSAPGKTLVLDFDNKVSSAATYYAHKNPDKLANIDVEQFSLNKVKDKPYLKFKAKLNELEKLASGEGKFPFDTITLDSTTLYSEALMAHVIEVNPGIKRAFSNVAAMQDYLVINTYFKEDMNRLLSLPCNVVCIAHSATSVDEQTGQTKNTILLSAKLAEHLPRIFYEVYWARVMSKQSQTPGATPEIRYMAQTRSDGVYLCRTQIPTIPFLVDLDFQVIQKHQNESVKTKGEVK